MGQNPPAWLARPNRRQRPPDWASLPPQETKKGPVLREKTAPVPPRHQRAGVEPEPSKKTAVAWCTKCRRDRPHRADPDGYPIEGSCRSCAFDS